MFHTRLYAALRCLAWLLFAGVLICFAVVEVYRIWREGLVGSDFKNTIWLPAHVIIEGSSPYGLGELAGSVYPPSAFVPVVWLGSLSFNGATIVWTAGSLAAAFATLWVLDVRDPRCYLVWMLNAATLSTAITGNATTIVVLLVAAMWRYRDDARSAGVAIACATAIKLFVAPVIVWFVFTRRYRAALYAVVACLTIVFVAWAAIRFHGLGGYPSVLNRNADEFSGDGPFLQGFLQQVGLDLRVAQAAGVATGLVLLSLAWITRADDTRALTFALLSAILASPVAWVGYATVLVVPLAARFPRFNPWWLVFGALAYVHWWHSPLAFRSAGLSIATLGLTAVLAAAGIGVGRDRAAEAPLRKGTFPTGPSHVAREPTPP